MQINHNIGAMLTQHALYQNNTAMGKSLEKLSTGLRINRAQDDAAGLAMSEQMRAQIRGLGKAKRNAQDGIGALQIAEGGLAEITNMLQRQKELAVQAANDTLTSTERKYLDMEFQELTKEIARISKTTDYNGKNMLNWSEDPNLSFGAIGDKNLLQNQMEAEHAKMMSYIEQLTAMTKGFVTTGLASIGGASMADEFDGFIFDLDGHAPGVGRLGLDEINPPMTGRYLDANGKPILEDDGVTQVTVNPGNGYYLFLDADYNPKVFYALDEDGDRIQALDSQGNPAVDSLGNPIWVLADPTGIGAALDTLKHLASLPNDPEFYNGNPLYVPASYSGTYTSGGATYVDNYRQFLDDLHEAYNDALANPPRDPHAPGEGILVGKAPVNPGDPDTRIEYFFNPENGLPVDKNGNSYAPPVQNPANPNWTVAGAFQAFERAVAAIDLKAMDPPPMAMKDVGFLEATKERLEIIVNSISQPKEDSLSRLYLEMVKNDMTNAASYTLHIGPNYSNGMGTKWANEMTVTYISFNPGSLGLSTKNLKMQHHATEAIDHLDSIIKDVAGVRAKIGTYINRLEYTINNTANLEYNTQDAESRIRDTDFAFATTEFTKNQILVQSATSMLAQANTLPQTALQLLQ